MLGPDIELLSEILAELGQKHVKYGVKPEMFPIMGDCLIGTLIVTLKEEAMNEDVVAAWREVYKELSGDMVRAQKLVTG
jgi:hemoglobin-like flavoprotein